LGVESGSNRKRGTACGEAKEPGRGKCEGEWATSREGKGREGVRSKADVKFAQGSSGDEVDGQSVRLRGSLGWKIGLSTCGLRTLYAMERGTRMALV